MIPWVREKFAERRAKWLARSKRSQSSGGSASGGGNKEDDDECSETRDRDSPRFHRLNCKQEDDDDEEDLEDDTDANSPGHSSQHSSSRHQHNSPTPSRHQQQQCHHATRSLHSSPVKLAKKSSRRSSAASSSITNTLVNTESYARGCSSPRERIKVRVICPSARLMIFQTDGNRRLLELKNEIILELADDLLTNMPMYASEPKSLATKFRLLKADYQGSELNEGHSLEQLGIGNNDTLVLVAKRGNIQQLVNQTRETRSPSDKDIELATVNLPVRSADVPLVDINEIFQQSNLHFDVRKVLISLAQASAVVIGSGPYAKRLIAMLKQKLINKRNYQNDTTQCLVDMGFKKEKAEYALKLHNNVYSAALEWLIQRQSQETSIEEVVMGIPRTSSMASPSGILSSDNTVENIAALLEIVRIYSYRDIPPTPDAVQTLVEMGFQESDVIEALKKTCNNKAAACEWLCGNRTGSLVELREGLAQDSPILKTILQLPQVQLSLSNPEILLAFLAILENEQSIRVWGDDNDTTSVITHILQKYHEEKHVLGINQFYSSR
ncbi:ubiquitin-associated domain-containing protein 1 isoform X1 [Musca domestica]|uniref:Ubiquitin-associated domain-containing protein 1 isoform X1 n=1 Tax=Musca domestica TaxID=7370 RepID=A0A9J7CVU3_MUSDO|nr:ubiquitin-associated domain-containing protein 1 isoform X1 [Musca domestica]